MVITLSVWSRPFGTTRLKIHAHSSIFCKICIAQPNCSHTLHNCTSCDELLFSSAKINTGHFKTHNGHAPSSNPTATESNDLKLCCLVRHNSFKIQKTLHQFALNFTHLQTPAPGEVLVERDELHVLEAELFGNVAHEVLHLVQTLCAEVHDCEENVLVAFDAHPREAIQKPETGREEQSSVLILPISWDRTSILS